MQIINTFFKARPLEFSVPGQPLYNLVEDLPSEPWIQKPVFLLWNIWPCWGQQTHTFCHMSYWHWTETSIICDVTALTTHGASLCSCICDCRKQNRFYECRWEDLSWLTCLDYGLQKQTHTFTLLGLPNCLPLKKSRTSVMTLQKPAVSLCAEFSGWNTSLCSNSNSLIFTGTLTVTTYSWLIMKLSEILWSLFFKRSFLWPHYIHTSQFISPELFWVSFQASHCQHLSIIRTYLWWASFFCKRRKAIHWIITPHIVTYIL